MQLADRLTQIVRRVVLFCGVAFAVAAPPAVAAPGDLDASFATAGTGTLDFGGNDRASHLTLAPDGGIVIAGTTDAAGGGDYAVARLRSDGTPDPAFGSGGKVRVGTAPGVGGGVVVQPDGKIVVTGQGNATNDFVTQRLNADGTLDTSFGTGGTSTVDFGGNDIANNLARQPDGKLVLVGSTDAVGGGDFAVARLNADGTPDTSFGTAGKQTVDFGGNDAAYGVAIQPDGKILVAGGGDPVSEIAIARLNANGSMDTSFGVNGEQTVDVGGTSRASSVAVQSDGRIVIVGGTAAASGHFAVARLTASGALDPTFNGGGTLTFGYGGMSQYETGLGVAIQQNGRIVVMGTGGPTPVAFRVARLNPDGSFDTTFGSGGTATINPGGNAFDGDAVLAPDGSIVFAGTTDAHATEPRTRTPTTTSSSPAWWATRWDREAEEEAAVAVASPRSLRRAVRSAPASRWCSRPRCSGDRWSARTSGSSATPGVPAAAGPRPCSSRPSSGRIPGRSPFELSVWTGRCSPVRR